jgi:TIR domain
MAPQVLFGQVDVFDVVERHKARLQAEYQSLPDDAALDPAMKEKLIAKYMLDVPVLKPEEMTYEEGKTKVDARRQPNRIFFHNTGPVWEDATEVIVHVPFSGDPVVFSIAPSAYNSRIAQGEVVDHELLLRVTVVDSNYDVQAHIDREIQQINWALTHLREKDAYFRQELGAALAIAAQKRQRAVESRASVIGRLGIPKRPPSPVVPVIPAAKEENAMMTVPPSQQWDVFISHASEDKPYVDPLVAKLEAAGVSVWYDRLVLEWGDDLRPQIDNGLINCRYGIVVFSKAFLAKKKWTEHELNGLFAREKAGQKLVLPIWHNIERDDLLQYSPTLADRLAKISSTDSYDDIVASLLGMLGKTVKPPATAPTPQTAAPSSTTKVSGPKGEVLSYANYEGKDGMRVHLYVRKSAHDSNLFVIENADEQEHVGPLEEIAIQYTVADRKLTMNGYKRMGFFGNGQYPQFNLG